MLCPSFIGGLGPKVAIPAKCSLSLIGPRATSETVSRGISADILMLDFTTAGSTCFLLYTEREDDMPDSVYKVIELIGTSNDSWEKAAANAVEQAAKSLRDLRIAEVVKLDMQLDAKGKVEAYRAKLNVSFKFDGS
jgi:dodecin